MAFQLTLNIKDDEKVFVRNGEPTLRDISNATKLQRVWFQMANRDGGATEEDIDNNERLLAQFSVDFFHSQFTKQEVIDGATYDAVREINQLVLDILATEQKNEDEVAESPKRRKRTSPGRSAKSTSSTTPGVKKATN